LGFKEILEVLKKLRRCRKKKDPFSIAITYHYTELGPKFETVYIDQ